MQVREVKAVITKSSGTKRLTPCHACLLWLLSVIDKWISRWSVPALRFLVPGNLCFKLTSRCCLLHRDPAFNNFPLLHQLFSPDAYFPHLSIRTFSPSLRDRTGYSNFLLNSQSVSRAPSCSIEILVQVMGLNGKRKEHESRETTRGRDEGREKFGQELLFHESIETRISRWVGVEERHLLLEKILSRTLPAPQHAAWLSSQ